MRKTTITRSLVLTTVLLASQACWGGTVSFSVTGANVTTGTDPFGNQYQISQFGGNTVLSLPGYPHLFAGAGLLDWLGPDCILDMTVSAFNASTGTALTIDPFSAFYNTTAPSGFVTFNEVINGTNNNTITFTAPTLADIGRSAGPGVAADRLNIATHAVNPSGAAVRFDVTYTTLDHAPEPSTWALLGSALIGLASIRRRKQ